jgi:hypothetical protein
LYNGILGDYHIEDASRQIEEKCTARSKKEGENKEENPYSIPISPAAPLCFFLYKYTFSIIKVLRLLKAAAVPNPMRVWPPETLPLQFFNLL